MTYIMFIHGITDMDAWQLILLCIGSMLPLCFVKDWESLAILSKIKTFVFAAVTLLIVCRAAFDEKVQTKAKPVEEFFDNQATWFSIGALESFGKMAFAVMCICGHFTGVLLVRCAERIGVDSYEKLTEQILGLPGYLFLCALCIVVNVGAAV